MKTGFAKSEWPICRRLGGALKALVVIGSVALALSAQAATAKIGNYTWTYVKVKGGVQIGDGENVAVTPATGAITIPSKIGKLAVKSIANKAFYECKNITAVKIPKGVTSIGISAFRDCNSLQSVSLPSSLKSIGISAFDGCINLQKVAVPKGVKTLKDRVFACCTSLSSVSLPATLTEIGEEAFFYCTSLTNVTIPNGVTSIWDDAFYDCGALESVFLPHSITNIGPGAFWLSLNTGAGEVRYEVEGDDVRFKGMDRAFGEYGADHINFRLYCKLTVKPNSKKHGTAGIATGTALKASRWEYAAGELTLLAKPKKGKVFAGWYQDKACKKPLDGTFFTDAAASYRQKKLAIAMPRKHTTIYAKFITKAADKKALKFSSATKKLAKTATTLTPESSCSLKIAASSASTVTYSAKGLPAGLTIDSATGEIKGAPTKPGKFTATVTVKSAGGNKVSQKVKFTVYAEAWAQGAYAGYARPGTKDSDPPASLSLSIGSTGNVSGKVVWKGKAYPFTAQCSYSTGSETRFSPSIKIGKTTYKPGEVTVWRNGDVVSARTMRFCAYKKAMFVSEGGRLGALVGQTRVLSEGADISDLEKVPVALELLFCGGDMLEVKGTVNGNPVSFSTQLCVNNYYTDASDHKTAYYYLSAPVILYKYGYYRAFDFTVYVDVKTGASTLEYSFLNTIDWLWNNY